ncbi:MAG: hypothetical protein JNM77_00015 [Pseudonocardia sp.]|nr:hypothetical protein [Pseudonocardia sp.]
MRVLRAPVSRPGTSATGRPERPDPCADPPTVTIDPTRVMPAVPGVPGDDPVAATVPRLRSVTPAGGGAVGEGRGPAAASALGALGGLAGWLLAARTVAPDRLGAAVAVVAVVAVAACVARPDRGAALVPRLPAAGRRAGRVVVRGLAAAVALGAGVGAVLAVLVPGPAATLGALLPGPSWLGVLLVAAAAAAWAAGAVFDGVVVALDRPWWATAHGAVLVAGRIALILAVGVLLGGGAAGGVDRGWAGWMAAAWLAPVLLWMLPGSAAVAVLARRHGRRVETAAPPRVLGPTAVARLGATLLHQVVPLLVVLGLGPGPGMVFFVAWQVVTAVDLTAVWMLGRAGGTSRRRLLVTLGPALALVAAGAAALLGVFGPDYAAAADVLRVLLLGAAFRLVIVHELGALEAAGRAWSPARLHLSTSVPTLLVVGLSVAAVAATGLSGLPSGTAGTVLLPVAAAYTLVQVACCVAVLVLFPTRSRIRPEEQL